MFEEITSRPAQVVQGSDGIARRAFSADDVRRMQDAGIMDEDEPFELIEGELVFMNAQGFAHDLIKTDLTRKLVRFLPEEFFVGAEVSVQLTGTSVVQPDIIIGLRRAVLSSPEGFLTIPAAHIMLVVEVAATSLSIDRGRKAALYAREAVAEYWIIDAKGRRAWIYRDPTPEGFGNITAFSANEELRPASPDLAGFAVRLAELG